MWCRFGHGETRIGIDDQDSYEFLCDFIETVSGKGECEMFIIHARKARLSGLSQKRTADPPLDYRVWQLKRDFPTYDGDQRRHQIAGRSQSTA